MARHQGAAERRDVVVRARRTQPPEPRLADLGPHAAARAGDRELRRAADPARPPGHDGLVNHALRNRFIRDEARALEEADVREFFAAWLERRSRAELPPGAELDRAELDAAIDDTVTRVLAFCR
jgi:hypothetical protein